MVTDTEKRSRIATLYRQGAEQLVQTYVDAPFPAADLRAQQFPRFAEPGAHLYQHLHEVPVLVIPCIEGRFETAGVCWQATLYGSILPAVLSFMLALRARGLRRCTWR